MFTKRLIQVSKKIIVKSIFFIFFIFVGCKPITVKFDDHERFRLYSTENIWNFLLLDSHTGKIWQCQFSIESGKEKNNPPYQGENRVEKFLGELNSNSLISRRFCIDVDLEDKSIQVDLNK